jgi:predicted O-methyltransferase YrrM
MYSRLQIAIRFLTHYVTAVNGKGHGIHSPFVFDFITTVLNDRTHYPAYDTVEAMRKKLLGDHTILDVEDFGAGSALKKANRRTIAFIAKNSAKPKKQGQLLFRMVKKYAPVTIVELGTSLGITTAYLSLANPHAKVITLEGAPSIVEKARQNFATLRLENISITEGKFDETLKGVLKNLPSVDFCFMDGNHRKEPTLQYFSLLKDKVKNNSILIFDDIHWSPEMEQAWEMIKQDASVRCSIDLFFMGIVFFRDAFREKQHFRIRF